MMRTAKTAAHNAAGNSKHEVCPSLCCLAYDGYRVLVARNLLTVHRTMPTASRPPRATGVIFCRRGAMNAGAQ
jgi:hypothetical protein